MSLEERLRLFDALLCREYGAKINDRPDDPVSELVHTILTQNTSDLNSDRTYHSLRHEFETWEQVADANADDIARAIRMGGLGDIKARRIKEVLSRIRDERGAIDLSFLADMRAEDAYAYLTSLPGVGPKTAACVLLFSLKMPVFPVDTHVHRVAQRTGIAQTKNPEATQELMNSAMPSEIAYQLHMNMVTHGRLTCIARSPKCGSCVLRSECRYASRKTED